MRLDVVYKSLFHPSSVDVDDGLFRGLNVFLEFLATLTLDDWLGVGASPPVEAHTVAILEATVADRRLQLDAWRVRDAVETLAFLACCPLPPRPRDLHRAMVRARAAAEHAGLAIIARDWLAPSDVAELLSPFSDRASAVAARAP
jgi:hypothetical protein